MLLGSWPSYHFDARSRHLRFWLYSATRWRYGGVADDRAWRGAGHFHRFHCCMRILGLRCLFHFLFSPCLRLLTARFGHGRRACRFRDGRPDIRQIGHALVPVTSQGMHFVHGTFQSRAPSDGHDITISGLRLLAAATCTHFADFFSQSI